MDSLPWATQIETDQAGNWQRIHWALTAQGLREALLGPAHLPILRSASPDKPKSILLLSDVITLDARLVAMNILAIRETDISVTIEASITSEQEIGFPLQATLELSGHTRTVPVNESGRAIFSGVRTSTLVDLDGERALTDLRVTIERAAAQTG